MPKNEVSIWEDIEGIRVLILKEVQSTNGGWSIARHFGTPPNNPLKVTVVPMKTAVLK